MGYFQSPSISNKCVRSYDNFFRVGDAGWEAGGDS